MIFDLTAVTHGLLQISLEAETLEDYARQTIQYIFGVPGLCARPKCGIFVLHSQHRSLDLLAQSGMGTEFPSAHRPSHCFFTAAARTGETSVVQSKDCTPQCDGHCTDNLHILPLKRGAHTIGLMAVYLSEFGSPSEDQIRMIRLITDIIARSIGRMLDVHRLTRIAELVAESPWPILECTSDGPVLYTNPSAKKILWQHSLEEDELLPPNHIELIRTCIASGEDDDVTTSIGQQTWSWHYHYAPETKTIHLFGIDISSQQRIETRLAHDALHDDLTGLPNRTQLLGILKNELSVIKRRPDYAFALLLFDLDRFKSVIESLGFSAGNVVLQEMANRLVQWQGPDHIVARLGEDEFAIVLEDLRNIPEILNIANDINELIRQAVDVSGTTITLTSSCGVAIVTSENLFPETILQNASSAVYRAKRQGGNSTEVYDKEMHNTALRRLRISNELTDAMSSGDLTVYYQPIFGLRDMRLRGFEALVRWNHPEKGLLSPGVFIPIAEESRLIDALGDHVLRLVSHQLTQWKTQNLPLAWISFNISAHQFRRLSLVDDIFRIVEEEKADPHRLCVEITEGTAAEQPEHAFQVMSRLRETGIRISLDDFGTGYSSLSYLKRFPIDTLKIDKSFIDGLPETPDDAAIVISVISMAQSMGMKVVAEGVEDENQAMFLRAQNCDEVQGFLYGKPMPISEATALLSATPIRRAGTNRGDPTGPIRL